MTAKCPHCEEELRVELTAKFVDRVDPAIVDLYKEELVRMQKRTDVQGGMFGGMMKMAAGMAKGMQETLVRMMQGMIEHPPMMTILKCMNCDAVLGTSLPTSDNSD